MLLSQNANKSRSSPDHFASAADENTCDTSIAKIQTTLLREWDPLKLKSEQNKKSVHSAESSSNKAFPISDSNGNHVLF